MSLNDIDIFAAELRQSIRFAIPQINALFNNLDEDLRNTCARVLLKIFDEGKISISC